MHSYHHLDTDIIIHHNGDYSGQSKIMIPASIIDKHDLSEIVHLDEHGNLWIEDVVPAVVLADFSYDATISHVISALENLDPPKH